MTVPPPLGCLAGVFDAEGKSLVEGIPALDQATADAFSYKAMIGTGAPTVTAAAYVTSPIGRVWALKPGATLDLVPAAERMAARAVLRCGQGVLLLAPDAETEKVLRIALLALAEGDERGGEVIGHA